MSPQKMRLHGITDMQNANRFLREVFPAEHNARFAKPAERETGPSFLSLFDCQRTPLPFPDTDQTPGKKRPALVLASLLSGDLLVCMIAGAGYGGAGFFGSGRGHGQSGHKLQHQRPGQGNGRRMFFQPRFQSALVGLLILKLI